MTNPPTSTPDTSSIPVAAPASVTVTGHAAISIVELLEHCEKFLRTSSPQVRAELLTFLDQQPTRPDAGWLVDMLGFNALYLQGKLAIAATVAAHHGTDQSGERP